MAKKPSSDTKAIKIQKLLEKYRDNDNSHFEAIMESKTAAQLENVLEKQMTDINKDVVISEFKLPNFDNNKSIECDRFIPRRCLDSDFDIENIMNTKIEIEHCPPYNWNLDATASENTPQNNQTNIQGQPSGNEVNHGENAKKYNILLQTQLLNIENPHMQCGFLNDNNKINMEPAKQKVLGQLNFDQLSLLGQEPMDGNYFSQQHMDQDSALVNTIKADGYKMLKFNNKSTKKRDLENQVPNEPAMQDFRTNLMFDMLEDDDLLSLPYKQ